MAMTSSRMCTFTAGIFMEKKYSNWKIVFMKMQTTAVSFSITFYLVKIGWLGEKENK